LDKEAGSIFWYISEWNGDSWTSSRIPTAKTNHTGNGGAIRINNAGNVEAHLITGDGKTASVVSAEKPAIHKNIGRGGDYTCYERIDGTWHAQTLVSEHKSLKPDDTFTVINGTNEFSVLSTQLRSGSIENNLVATGTLF
jgi:hypothetical protein